MDPSDHAEENKTSYNVFVGTETGLLKGVNIEDPKWQNLNTVDQVNRNHEINLMCWGNFEQTKFGDQLLTSKSEVYRRQILMTKVYPCAICMGRRDQSVLEYDVSENEIVKTHDIKEGDGTFCGLERYETGFITCTTAGLLKVWKENRKYVEMVKINVGADVCKMRQNNETPTQVATGGKENDLKLWDLTHPSEPIFRAKNVRHDFLDLQVPIWLKDMSFIPGSNRIITCTAHHQIRMYDPSTSQRRPILDFEFDEYPLTSMALVPGKEQIIVGNTQGAMALLDIRGKGLVVRKYKGFAGAIRSVQCHPTLPMIASCGLDRFLRIHDLNDSTLLHKLYMKSPLNCLLFAEKWTSDQPVADTHDMVGDVKTEGEDLEIEDMWDKMEVIRSESISDKRKRKYGTESINLSSETKLKKNTLAKTSANSDDVTRSSPEKKMKKRKRKKGMAT